MDTNLRVTDPSLELQRAEVVKTLMQPLAIIQSFNKRKYLSVRVVAGVTYLMMNQFIFERAEEALRHDIVVAIDSSAHTGRQAEFRETTLIR